MRRVDAFFLPMGRGKRFCLMHTPGAAPHGAFVFVHGFAEELNNCRRMAALQARAFADEGWAVLQMDLFGCGDSSGDFGDAEWECWVDDVVGAAAWLQRESGHVPGLWGVRAGCLLAVEAARRIETPGFVFWQPVVSGRQHLQQFLRLKLASDIVGAGAVPPVGPGQLRQQLESGQSVEIAGYTIAPALAKGLEHAELALPHAGSRKIAWLEASGSPEPELLPASKMRVQDMQEAGQAIAVRVVRGPAFWQVPEMPECAPLVGATLAAVHEWA